MFYGMPTLQLTKISGFLMSIKNKTRQNKAENPKPKDKRLQISPDKSSIWLREQKVKALPDAEQEPPASAPQDSAFPQHSLHGQRSLGDGWREELRAPFQPWWFYDSMMCFEPPATKQQRETPKSLENPEANIPISERLSSGVRYQIT